MNTRFEVGDLVRYNDILPMYLPVMTKGIGIVTKVGKVDLRVYSMTRREEVTVRGSQCVVLSKRKHETK